MPQLVSDSETTTAKLFPDSNSTEHAIELIKRAPNPAAPAPAGPTFTRPKQQSQMNMDSRILSNGGRSGTLEQIQSAVAPGQKDAGIPRIQKRWWKKDTEKIDQPDFRIKINPELTRTIFPLLGINDPQRAFSAFYMIQNIVRKGWFRGTTDLYYESAYNKDFKMVVRLLDRGQSGSDEPKTAPNTFTDITFNTWRWVTFTFSIVFMLSIVYIWFLFFFFFFKQM